MDRQTAKFSGYTVFCFATQYIWHRYYNNYVPVCLVDLELVPCAASTMAAPRE